MPIGLNRGTVRWYVLARWVGFLVALAVTIAAVIAFRFWMPVFPRELGRRLTEGFLRTLLIGYASALTLVLPGVFLLVWMLLRARRRRQRRPWLARWLLLCVSFLFGVIFLEAAAGVWLIWAHRMPTLPARFAAAPKEELSVVALGGSSAMGYPYDPHCSPAQIVAAELQRALPDRKVVVDLRAKMGHSLEMEHQALSQLKRRPDVLIVCAGNNEFLARFEGTRDVALDEAPLDPALNQLYRISQRSWLCRMIYETVSKNRLGGPPGILKRHHVIDPPLCTPSEYEAIRSDFHRRLEAIVQYCERLGTIPVLMIPPGNESGFEPTRSALPSATKDERAAATEAFEAARAVEWSDPALSRERYRALVERHPQFAEAQFRLGRLLEQARDWEGARRHYALARDHDTFPVRCATPFQKAYRDVAQRHDCILIDGPEVVRAVTPRKIVDDHVIHDAHHPTLAGQVALAEAILGALRARKAFGWNQGDVPTLSQAKVADEFGVDSEAWQAVCAKASTFYRDFSHARYDPTERLEKMRRFADAGRRIADGVPPEQTGVPGLGVRAPH